MKITNNHGVSLALAVWLINDDYDYNPAENYISVTGLMRPLRQIILGGRVDASDREADVVDYAARALGNAVHDSVEKAWVKNYVKNLKKLGTPEKVIARVLINPTDDELRAKKDAIPIYIEQRAFKQVGKWKVGGKFDMVAEGIVHDNKTTSAWTWVYGGRDEEHGLQGSLYRWLNPDKITEDFIRINYVFTDWQKSNATTIKGYPPHRVADKDIPLKDITDTDLWVKEKLRLVDKYLDAPEKDIPLCTPDELWMSDPSYKFYADPSKTSGRSTKNFSTLAEAKQYMADKGGKGTVITVPGEPKRCEYCEAFDICSQKDAYFS